MYMSVFRALYASAGLAAFAAVVVGVAEPSAAPQKPNSQRSVLYPNYGPPPASLEELWSASALVVRGAVENSHVRTAGVAKPPTVVTDHRFRVNEVLKGDLPGHKSVIHVLQSAGTLVVGGEQITVEPGSMPVLASGQEALLFLNEWAKGGGFSITAGPSGLVVLNDTYLRVPALFRNVFPAQTADRTQFLEAFRQWIKARPAK